MWWELVVDAFVLVTAEVASLVVVSGETVVVVVVAVVEEEVLWVVVESVTFVVDGEVLDTAVLFPSVAAVVVEFIVYNSELLKGMVLGSATKFATHDAYIIIVSSYTSNACITISAKLISN